ncbi:MAG: glycosyltransferase [Actinomycetota bacterium]|nr:glycosyltransferase [Actinomycetota bacterium]
MLSVIVPAYRAASTIYENLQALLDALDGLDAPYEVVVVPDGADDDTAKRAARHHDRIHLAGYPDHRGKGFAVRHGVAHCRGEHIAYIDADMELRPDGLGALLALVQGGADVALGSKRHPASRVRYPLFRRLQSALYQGLVRTLFDLDVSDTQTGLKVFRGDLLRDVAPTLESDGFAMDLELLVALRDRGARFAEGPVRLDYRFASTIGPRDTLVVLADTMRIYRRWMTRGRRRRSLARARTVARPRR